MRKRLNTLVYQVKENAAICLVYIGTKLISTICLITGKIVYTLPGLLLNNYYAKRISIEAKNLETDFNYHLN